MPIPTPKKDESKDEFIDRCMSDNKMVEEYEQDQRFAICMSKWEEKSESKHVTLGDLLEQIKGA